MQSKQKLETALGNGVATQQNNSLYNIHDLTNGQVVKGINDHKKIQEYCTPLFCLSCTYFQQIKGNFGRCGVIQKNEKFDGTKKGSGCRLWRLNPEIQLKTELIERPKRAVEYKSPSLIVQKKIHHDSAYEFNDLLAVVKKEKRVKEFAEVNEDVIRKLNPKYNTISEKSGSFHYYYMSKTPAHIIDYILILISKETPTEEIVKKIYSVYQYKITKGLVKLVELKWHKGLFRQIPDLMRKEIDTHCPKCKSEMVMKNGYRYTNEIVAQRIKCKSCNYQFRPDRVTNLIEKNPMIGEFIKSLYFQHMSMRKISIWLKTELGIKYTHTNICRIIHKLVPKEQLHKKKVNQSIYFDRVSLHFRQFIRYNEKVLLLFKNTGDEKHLDKTCCSYCGSKNTISNGIRKNKFFSVRRFQCKDCNRKYQTDRKYSRTKLSDQLVEKIIDLFQRENLSTRQIAKRIFDEDNIKITHHAVSSWIKKLIENPHFQKNASNRPEVKAKISQALTGKSNNSFRDYYNSKKVNEILVVCP